MMEHGARCRTPAGWASASRRSSSQKVHGADPRRRREEGARGPAHGRDRARSSSSRSRDEDIEKGLEELAAETGKNVAKVRAEYREPAARQILIGMILEDKVLDVIEAQGQDHRRPVRRGRRAEAAAAEAETRGAEGASKKKKAKKAGATTAPREGMR